MDNDNCVRLAVAGMAGGCGVWCQGWGSAAASATAVATCCTSLGYTYNCLSAEAAVHVI